MSISNNYVKSFISQIIAEELDKALSASNKRRKEFKNSFNKVFTEAETVPAAPAKPPAEPSVAPAADPNAPPADPTQPVPSPDATSSPPGTSTGDPNTTDPNAPPAEEESAEDTGTLGGGGGFGGFGGGGGGGGGGVGSMDEPVGTEEPDQSQEPEGAEEPQGDPIVSMVSTAQELLNQTNDPNLILKSLKGQIQTVFAEPEHALGLVKALYDTQDAILQAVAQRLYLFIKTAVPK